MSDTDELADLLKPLVPTKWAWVTDERDVTNPDVVTCVLTPNAIEPEPASSGGWLLKVTYQLTIIQPGTSADEVESPLYENVKKLLLGIKTLNRKDNPIARAMAWEKAVKALWQSTNLCWQITLYSTVNTLTE